MRYRKDLSHLTSIRLSNNLRNEARSHAKFKGLTFSEFMRESLNKNINQSNGDEEVVRRSSRLTPGRADDR